MFPEKYFPSKKLATPKDLASIQNLVGFRLRELLFSNGVVFQTKDNFEKYISIKKKCDIYFHLIDSSGLDEKTSAAAKDLILKKASEYFISHAKSWAKQGDGEGEKNSHQRKQLNRKRTIFSPILENFPLKKIIMTCSFLCYFEYFFLRKRGKKSK